MKYQGAIDLKTRGKAALSCAAVLAALVLLAVAVTLARSGFSGPGLLAALPQPPEGAPLIVVDAGRGEFPLYPLEFFTESSAVSAAGTPLGSLLPIFARADRSALIVTEREAGLAFYGAVQLNRAEQRALAAGRLPEAWERLLASPRLTRAETQGAFEIRAANLAAPLHLELEGKRAYLAETRPDAEGIRAVRRGEAAAAKRRWNLERRWEGHMFLSDGGVLAAMAGDEAAGGAIGLEIAWNSHRKGGEAKWRVSGLERRVGKNLARSLKAYNWSVERPLMPDPLLLSIGINLPNPGKNLANLPGSAKSFADQLMRFGLREPEVAALFTGPVTLSIGGRAQILWFDLPGVVLDVPGRGKLAYKLLDLFWEQLFMGAEPKPADGFTHGGTTDLPFSVLAAANDKKMVVSLTEPASEDSREAAELIAKERKAIGWLYADLPSLGASLAEMPSMNLLLSTEDEARPVDSESTERLRETFDRMGRLFVVWDSPTGGHAVWHK